MDSAAYFHRIATIENKNQTKPLKQRFCDPFFHLQIKLIKTIRNNNNKKGKVNLVHEIFIYAKPSDITMILLHH